MKNQSFAKKLRNALVGIGLAWTEERNFRVHVALGLATLLAFAVLRPTALWWAFIVLCSALVLAAPLLTLSQIGAG
ncbi:diacylglycerol kinase [Candidatus Accumulibacter sp. ACC003]|uniref:diacylglycerol kinase n=1 Tax=Candidatus Accumulibacter sp. ACC003 TaxID=2823334 RepID=UPI0025BD7147|nr:diacylglycerol kinase [Candidatus Accumulibacter sp. ACC003]